LSLQHHGDVETSNINAAYTFLQVLCEKVGPFLVNRTLDIPKKVLRSIWLLANQESFRGVADQFDISKGTLHYIFSDICKVLCTLSNQYIQWPREDEFANLAYGFQDKTGFPGVIGAIDGLLPFYHPHSIETGKDMLVFNSKQCVHQRGGFWMCTLVGQGLCTMLECFATVH